jgi:hypothetical protein
MAFRILLFPKLEMMLLAINAIFCDSHSSWNQRWLPISILLFFENERRCSSRVQESIFGIPSNRTQEVLAGAPVQTNSPDMPIH